MKSNVKNKLALTFSALLALSAMAFTTTASADETQAAPKQCTERKQFTLAVSIYTGWMPWYYAQEQGLLKKWGDAYCMDIKLEPMDYGPSIDTYIASKAQALVVTNIDLLTASATVGKESTVIVVGDFSNGNDKMLTRGLALNEVKGQNVYLLDKSVSLYLTCRALESVNLSASDVAIVNTSDRDIQQNFIADKSQKAVVTWNPMAMGLASTRGIKTVFDSSKIPGEVQDLLVVDTKTIKANPDFGRALTGLWYEVTATMTNRGKAANEAMADMARLSVVSPTEFNGQLKTTAMFYTPDAAITFAASKDMQDKNAKVRQVTFSCGMMDEKITSVDAVGIDYPDGTVQGDKNNTLIHYTVDFMQEAKDGKLKR